MSAAKRNRRLVLLHRYNGWNLLFLLVTGIILYMPGLRGVTAPIRVPLKQAHIVSGILMAALLLLYLLFLQGHWERLARRVGQRINVGLIIAVTAGWTVTGIVLWLHRSLPPEWASAALVWHDYLTWIVLPWLAIHSVTRYFKLRLTLPEWITSRPLREPDAGRRAALTQMAAAIGSGLWAVYGWRVLTGTQEPQAVAAAAAAGGGDGSSAFVPTILSPDEYFSSIHPPIKEPDPGTPPDWPAPVPPTTGLFPATQPPHTTGEPPLPTPVKSPPTGGGRKGRFRVYTVTDTMPAFQPDKWRFFAQGLVDRPLNLGWKEFLHLPRVEQVSDFHCVTGWSVYNITWEGVRLRDLLDMLGVKPGADHLKFYSRDRVYTDDLPLDVARQDDIMLAYLIDGQLLPVQYGGPMRLIIPRMYAYKSVKWLGGLELIKGPHIGYWEERGYPRNAWLQKT